MSARAISLATKSIQLDGDAVAKYVAKKLSCGDCPAPCKEIVAVKSRGLSDVRRPDYETIAGFGANLLNDDLEIVTACHDACNRNGIDAVSSSATLAWVCEAVEEGILTPAALDGHRHALGATARARSHSRSRWEPRAAAPGCATAARARPHTSGAAASASPCTSTSRSPTAR